MDHQQEDLSPSNIISRRNITTRTISRRNAPLRWASDWLREVCLLAVFSREFAPCVRQQVDLILHSVCARSEQLGSMVGGWIIAPGEAMISSSSQIRPERGRSRSLAGGSSC